MVDRDERVRQDDRVRGDFCHGGLPEKNKRGIHVKTLEADGSGHVDRDRGNGDLRESEFADPDESPVICMSNAGISMGWTWMGPIPPITCRSMGISEMVKRVPG